MTFALSSPSCGKHSIKNGPETHIPFTRVRDKFLNGRIFYLCNSFTRNRANSVRDCSTVYKSPYQNLHSSPGPVKTKSAGCVQAFVRSKICRGTQRQFSENICSEEDLRSRIFGTFVVKFLACLPLLGFSNI